MTRHLWRPPDFDLPDSGKLGEIKAFFQALFPSVSHGGLSDDIHRYWVQKLKNVWELKPQKLKAKDLAYDTKDPLSRIEQKVVLIAYANSVFENHRPTLSTLEDFLKGHYPAVRGLHILPACEFSEERFNDGGFSQIRRDRIHASFGSNQQFEQLMETYYSMTDFVLNHVDVDHPLFLDYLAGNDDAGNCFYVFTEKPYQTLLAEGAFDAVFRPRPFPLFTIFRRSPVGEYRGLTHHQRISAINDRFAGKGLDPLPHCVVNMLYLFDKIKNDQMLLSSDYEFISVFREYLGLTLEMDPDRLFGISKTQETRHIPYIFEPSIRSAEDLLIILLPFLRIPVEKSRTYADIFFANDTDVFGESIRALTTFSHVQVDLNTSTFEGLKLLIDDFSWYLKMDLNMLRLDAANFAFKKWGTSCFGLPEVGKLMKILYLSMDAVSPRMVPNLEVNAPLSTILKQMADKEAPPPMMYDFHLGSMLPVVFNMADARPLTQIGDLLDRYDIPHESIRFSLDESHDGKSVNGSGGADPLLTYAQRKSLIDIVRQNGGHIKYKSSIKFRYPVEEFRKVCRETQLDFSAILPVLFKAPTASSDTLSLKENLQSPETIARALKLTVDNLKSNPALSFFLEKILDGREPYELCVSTRDSLAKLTDPVLEVKRYMAFKTLSFALMGRHVKAIYFNDLMGLPNDNELVQKTGELRNIKRTRSDRRTLEQLIGDPSDMAYWITRQINRLIALVDSDPSFHPKGNEAHITVEDDAPSVAYVNISRRDHHTLVLVNASNKEVSVDIRLSDFHLNPDKSLTNQITGTDISNSAHLPAIQLKLSPFDRYWIKNRQIKANPLLMEPPIQEEKMKKAFGHEKF